MGLRRRPRVVDLLRRTGVVALLHPGVLGLLHPGVVCLLRPGWGGGEVSGVVLRWWLCVGCVSASGQPAGRGAPTVTGGEGGAAEGGAAGAAVRTRGGGVGGGGGGAAGGVGAGSRGAKKESRR